MAKVFQFLFTCILFFICFGSTNCDIEKKCSRKLQNYGTIYVDPDPSSHTSFSNIQSAIDSVPSQNKNWISISVKAGIYNEQVIIPQDKPFIYLKGEGIGKTSVVWGAHDSMSNSSTFASFADNIVVSGITFVNSYNYPPAKNVNDIAPAVAARISGDKSALYECSFLGYQDTLLDDKGRHFYKNCTIEGAVDFIFGRGQSIYEECTIQVNVGIVHPNSKGYITAQARTQPNEPNGFVFKQCNVTGIGKTYLGRAWRAYSRVIYYDSFLSDIVVPLGWLAWNYVGQEDKIAFSEYECQGPGSDKSNRVKWEKDVSPELQSLFTNDYSYIDTEGWIGSSPLSFLA